MPVSSEAVPLVLGLVLLGGMTAAIGVTEPQEAGPSAARTTEDEIEDIANVVTQRPPDEPQPCEKRWAGPAERVLLVRVRVAIEPPDRVRIGEPDGGIDAAAFDLEPRNRTLSVDEAASEPWPAAAVVGSPDGALELVPADCSTWPMTWQGPNAPSSIQHLSAAVHTREHGKVDSIGYEGTVHADHFDEGCEKAASFSRGTLRETNHLHLILRPGEVVEVRFPGGDGCPAGQLSYANWGLWTLERG